MWLTYRWEFCNNIPLFCGEFFHNLKSVDTDLYLSGGSVTEMFRCFMWSPQTSVRLVTALVSLITKFLHYVITGFILRFWHFSLSKINKECVHYKLRKRFQNHNWMSVCLSVLQNLSDIWSLNLWPLTQLSYFLGLCLISKIFQRSEI